jgi:hypothetical protein
MRTRARGYDDRVADLASLRELHVWMRAEGILYARCGDLELRLEPAQPAPSATPEPEPLTDEQRERRDLEDLLHSSGVPADAILRLTKRAA